MVAGLVAAGSVAPSLADVQAVTLEPLRHRAATLVVQGTGGDQAYSPAQIEALGAHRMITRTPWRDQETVFDGALLSDILAANGLLDAPAIRVIAENDYAVTIPAAIWKNFPVLVATRVNGEPHNRRDRGPIQFILPMDDEASLGGGENLSYWVWMAARIEPVE